MQNIFFSILLVLLGIVYLVKPNIFKRWFWTKTSIAQRYFGPDGYEKYMRCLGIICILIGIALGSFMILSPR